MFDHDGDTHLRASVLYKDEVLTRTWYSSEYQHLEVMDDLISISKEMGLISFDRLPLFIGDTLAGKIAMRRLRDGV